MSEAITVRPFRPDEWPRYKAIRLRALLADPGVFSSNHAREAARPDDAWREALERPDLGVFAVLHGDEVIGMTGIVVDRDDPTTAVLWGSWLEPAWRGRGLSDAMYAARIAWARARPGLRRIVVSHRVGNEASRRANQRHGFAPTGAADRTWPDGRVEPELLYALDL